METRENSGILFKEQEKKSDRGPDYTGRATIGGIDYRIAAWIKEGGRGRFLSLAFSIPEPRPSVPRTTSTTDEDDLEF